MATYAVTDEPVHQPVPRRRLTTSASCLLLLHNFYMLPPPSLFSGVTCPLALALAFSLLSFLPITIPSSPTPLPADPAPPFRKPPATHISSPRVHAGCATVSAPIHTVIMAASKTRKRTSLLASEPLKPSDSSATRKAQRIRIVRVASAIAVV